MKKIISAVVDFIGLAFVLLLCGWALCGCRIFGGHDISKIDEMSQPAFEGWRDTLELDAQDVTMIAVAANPELRDEAAMIAAALMRVKPEPGAARAVLGSDEEVKKSALRIALRHIVLAIEERAPSDSPRAHELFIAVGRGILVGSGG